MYLDLKIHICMIRCYFMTLQGVPNEHLSLGSKISLVPYMPSDVPFGLNMYTFYDLESQLIYTDMIRIASGEHLVC